MSWADRIVCGPPRLADRVRRHLRSSEFGPLAVLKGGPSVDLYIEAFNFAVSDFGVLRRTPLCLGRSANALLIVMILIVMII